MSVVPDVRKEDGLARRWFLAPVLTLGLVGVLAAPQPAWATSGVHFRFTGQFAEASLYGSDESTCVVTEVYLAAVDGRIKQAREPEAASEAFVFISQFDGCREELLLSAIGFARLTEPEFTIDRRLGRAKLEATIQVEDSVSGTSFPVMVNLSWLGTSDPDRVKDRLQVRTPGWRLKVRYDGTFRLGQASGVIANGDTNFAAGEAVFANLGSVGQGEVIVARCPERLSR